VVKVRSSAVDADECDALSEALRFLGVLSTGGIEFLPVPVGPGEQGPRSA